MFAYCLNNPVNGADPNGLVSQWIKNAIRWLVDDIGKPCVKAIQSATDDLELTFSIGVNISGSPSFWSFNGQYGISIDAKGNVAEQYSYMGGITTGSPSCSGSLFVSMTDAPDIYALNGQTAQFGGSFATMVDWLPAYLGGDIMIIPSENSRVYYGLTSNVGIGTPGNEFHVEWGETRTVPGTSFNIYDKARSIYHSILDWCDS